MIFRLTMFGLIVATQLVVPSTLSARTTMSRQEIRSMPILERPSRPGHFYGNTVRRNHTRRTRDRSRPLIEQNNTTVSHVRQNANRQADHGLAVGSLVEGKN